MECFVGLLAEPRIPRTRHVLCIHIGVLAAACDAQHLDAQAQRVLELEKQLKKRAVELQARLAPSLQTMSRPLCARVQGRTRLGMHVDAVVISRAGGRWYEWL